MRKILFLIICSVFLISGCGSSGGGAAFFETVEVTAHCQTESPLGCDIIVWRLGDPNGNIDDQCDYDESEVWPNDVKVTIKSVVFPVIESDEASQIRIENVHTDYDPRPNTPSLASRDCALGYIVEPNGGLSFNVEVISLDQKDYFLIDHYDSLILGNAYYTYDVILTFNVVEIATDKKLDVSTNLTVQVHDYFCTGPKEDRVCDDKCVHP